MTRRSSLYKTILGIALVLVVLPVFRTVSANYSFDPNAGQLVTGTEQTIVSATAANGEGVNVGSWRGTLGDDNYHWVVAGTASGVNMQLEFGDVELNNANTLMLQTEFDLDATALSTMVQICDWVSSTSVDNAADTECTGGGWRTLNNRRVGITTTTATAYHWQIYNGYFNNGNTPVDTPLSNFVNGSNKIRIRYYSTTNSTATIAVDHARIIAVVNPVYTAAGFTNLGSGTVTGDYRSTNTVTQGASDNTYLQVAGTAGSISDFYLKMNDVRTYTGMNTILVRAEYSCANTGFSHRPKVWNFTTDAWVDLSTSSIACSTTDATNMFALNNITIADYVENGEMRIGWYGLSNSAVAIRIDQLYVMLGTTSTDNADCEIPFGTVNAGDCSNTRTIDTTAATSSWDVSTVDESNTFGQNYYALDNDGDVNVEEAAAEHFRYNVTKPDNSMVTGLFFSGRFMSGTGGTVQLAIRDYSSLNQATGGFTGIGASSTTALTYTDNITVGGVANGGPAGLFVNAEDHIDTINDQVWMRVRTTNSGATTSNSVNQVDFAMVSIQWVEDADAPVETNQYGPIGENLVTGTQQTVVSATAANVEGINIGSWRGTLSDDNYHWVVAGTTSGVDAQLRIGDVRLQGANVMTVQTEFDLDATALATLVQICDRVSSTNVDNAADAQCTGGGWRTLNNRRTTITSATSAAYTWYVYNGYFNNGNTPVSTPLTNFVDSNNEVLIRYYSTTNSTAQLSIDYLRIGVLVSPIYLPAGFTNLGTGTVTGDYRNISSVTQGASDNQYLQVAGTASSVSDFYIPFRNVKTYTGANSILVRAEYSCANTGFNHRPKIWNFNTSTWTDLTTSSIACSTTDVTNMFVLNNVTISDYVSNGEIRVGWRGLSNSTVAIRLDQLYVMLGTTNTTSGDCETLFGTTAAGDCTNTRDMDTTATASTWNVTAEDESNTFGHTYYALDNDGDVNVEEASANQIRFSVTKPASSGLSAVFHAMRITTGTGISQQLGLNDYTGRVGASGGFTLVGTAVAATTSYQDNVSIGGVGSGGPLGMFNSPYFYIDDFSNSMWQRVQTTASGTTTNNAVNQTDFAMTSIGWVEPAIVTTSTTGTQRVNVPPSTNNAEVGGAFTLVRDTGSTTVTSMTITESGTINANTNLTNLDIYYETAGSCTYNGTETLFGTASSFGAGDTATVTGSMTVGTSQVCVYLVTDVGAASLGNTIEFAISVPRDDVLVQNGSVSPATSVALAGTTTVSNNTSPDDPTSLEQRQTNDTVLSTGDWVSATSVKFAVSAQDTDIGDSLQLCVEIDQLGTGFSNTEDSCGSSAVYSGSPLTLTHTINGLSDATEYHWQARVKDNGGAYSNWISYGGNAESARDVGLDTTAPTGGAVYDGDSFGFDMQFNDGSLSQLKANWDSFNNNAAGIQKYEYSIGTTAGGTDIRNWTDNSTTISVTASSLTLQTSQQYFFNVRATDNAGNVSSVVSSNGQIIAPTLSFNLSSSSIVFSDLSAGNNFSDTETTTITTSTNAFNGYIVRAYKTDAMRSLLYPSTIIGDFDGGTYAAPSAWTLSNYGFGYTSSDTLIQGAAKFPASGACSGSGTAPCFAPFSSVGPGDIVADHTVTVSGAPIVSEEFDITYRIQTNTVQPAGDYSTTVVYTIIPQY